MHYVYIIQSVNFPEHFYTGYATDVEERLKAHNHGQDSHTKKYKPWKIKTYIAFSDKKSALDFERYLKTGSGRVFAKKRL